MRKIPIVAIRGSVVFPFSDTLLSFGRNKSVNAVNASFTGDRMVAVFAQKDGKKEDPGKEEKFLAELRTLKGKIESEHE